MKISVTIIARNEADRLPAALASVAWADEILVLESGSTDATAAIAAAAGARVVQEPWLGFGPTKNRAAELARNDWILNLDADERVEPALADAIRALSEISAVAAYRVRRRNRVGGVALKHWPWAWDEQPRLYDRRAVRFRPVAVHESLERLDASPLNAALLPGVLDHLTYRDWADCRARQERYAALWAEQAHARGRRAGPPSVFRAPAAFFQHFFLRGYVRSGRTGWRMALMAAFYTALKYRLLRAASARAHSR